MIGMSRDASTLNSQWRGQPSVRGTVGMCADCCFSRSLRCFALKCFVVLFQLHHARRTLLPAVPLRFAALIVALLRKECLTLFCHLIRNTRLLKK